MTAAQRKLIEGLLILVALWLQKVLRRRHAKTETRAARTRLRLGDLLAPRDWNGFLRVVIFVSVSIGVVAWFIVFMGLTVEAGIWMVKQSLGYIPQSQPFWFFFTVISIPLAWMVFAGVSRRWVLGKHFDALLETPTAVAAGTAAVMAGCGVALIVYAQHHHLFLLS